MEALQALGHNKSSLSVFVADMTLFDRFDLAKHEKHDQPSSWNKRAAIVLGEDAQLSLDWPRWTMSSLIQTKDKEENPLVRELESLTKGTTEFAEAYFRTYKHASVRVRKRALYLRKLLNPILRQDSPTRRRFYERLAWLRVPDEHFAERVIADYHEHPFIAFSVLLSFLERALGDLAAFKTAGKDRVPMRINELLAMPALEDIFNPDIIFLVRTSIGPPQGMNLRNIVWHGFCDLEDFHPCYVDFLLVLVASLGDVLAGRWIGGKPTSDTDPTTNTTPDFLPSFIEWEKKIQIASPIEVKEKYKKIRGNWGQASRNLERMQEKYGHHLDGWSPRARIFQGEALNAADVEDIGKLIERSYLVTPQRVQVWKLAFNEWLRYKGWPTLPLEGKLKKEEENDKEDEEDRDWHHFKCLVLALPLLEHALRRVFVLANGLSEVNMLTAEPATYYLTLDAMMAETNEWDNGTNMLAPFLGDYRMQVLSDLFSWPLGPRLRIIVSHGVADPSSLSENFTDLFIVSLIELFAAYDPLKQQPQEGLSQPLVSKCSAYVPEYRPYYHPVSFLQRATRDCHQEWLGMHVLIERDKKLQEEEKDLTKKRVFPQSQQPKTSPEDTHKSKEAQEKGNETHSDNTKAKENETETNEKETGKEKEKQKEKEEKVHQEAPKLDSKTKVETTPELPPPSTTDSPQTTADPQQQQPQSQQEQPTESEAGQPPSPAANNTPSRGPPPGKVWHTEKRRKSMIAQKKKEAEQRGNVALKDIEIPDAVMAVRGVIERVSERIRATYKVEPLFQLDKVEATDATNFAFGGFEKLHKAVFCSKQELSTISILRDTTLQCVELAVEIKSRYDSVLELVRSRKATNAKRKVFARLRETLPFFADLIALFMLLIEDCTWHQILAEKELREAKRVEEEKVKETKEKEREAKGLPKLQVSLRERVEDEGGNGGKEEEVVESETYRVARKLMDTIGRALYFVNDNSWDRVVELFYGWIGDESKNYKFLSNRERKIFWNCIAEWEKLHASPTSTSS